MVDTEPFHKNLGEMLLAIEACLLAKWVMPSFVLMYSLIDCLAWAGSVRADQGVRKNFEAWVNDWLIPELAATAPEIRPVDLYAARCATLHTLTGDSDLTRSGKAKRIAYAWGTGQLDVLRFALKESGVGSKIAALHTSDLLDALCRALDKFLERANTDPELASRLEEAACRHYVTIPAS